MHVHRSRTPARLAVAVLAVAGCTAAALVAGSAPSRATNAAASPKAVVSHKATPSWGGPRVKATAAEVSVADPTTPFEQNAQVQPALAVDPIQPNTLVSTAYDSVDTQPCSKKASIDAAACSEPATAENGGLSNAGVGITGVYWSFDSGKSWMQPTFRGLTAVGCNPSVEPCKPVLGPIHTVPNYYQHGLTSWGDSSVAFGPVLKNGKFSWANGSRMYLSNIVTNLTQTVIKPGSIDTTTTTAISYLDDPTPARVAKASSWSAPIIVPKTEPAVSFQTEDQVWADNASSSRYFGNVYVCYNDFYFEPNGTIPVYPTVAVSTDGGRKWTVHHVATPIDDNTQGARIGCSIRTDSHGNVYVVWTHNAKEFPSNSLKASEDVQWSANGGATWSKPLDVENSNTGCYYWDPPAQRCAEEGPGGNPAENVPSIDVANGAPSGRHATNEMVLTWVDGRYGQNHEAALLAYSTNSGRNFSSPEVVSVPSDRADLSAVAISPTGRRVYMTYTAFTTPFSASTSTPRLFHGVLRSAWIGWKGVPRHWVTDYSGPTGDARGTGMGGYNYEEYTGWYVGAIATRRYGAGVWTDLRATPDCPAMDAWREKSLEAGNVVTPTPWPLTACPANFGNSKIWSATTAR
jgi:hypothetical protein